MATYEEVKADYERLVELTGDSPDSDIEDFCGAICNTEMYWELLRNPTKNTAKKMYINFIKEAFFRGFDYRGNTPDLDSHEVYEIYRKYH